MPNPRSGRSQHPFTLLHPRIHTRSAARLNGVDGILHASDVRCGRHFAGDERLRIKTDHPDLIARTQQLHRRFGGLTRQLNRNTLHTARFINYERHRHRRRLLLFFKAGVDRQHFFHRRFIVTAQTKTIFRPHHQQPTAKVVYVAFQIMHSAVGNIGGGYIGEHHRIKVQQSIERERQPDRRAHIDTEALFFERLTEMAHSIRRAMQHQNPRLSHHIHLAPRDIICGETVFFGDQFHLPQRAVVGSDNHVKRKTVIALGIELHALSLKNNAAVNQAQFPFHFCVCREPGFNAQAFAGIHTGRRRHDLGNRCLRLL